MELNWAIQWNAHWQSGLLSGVSHRAVTVAKRRLIPASWTLLGGAAHHILADFFDSAQKNYAIFGDWKFSAFLIVELAKEVGVTKEKNNQPLVSVAQNFQSGREATLMLLLFTIIK